MTLLFALYTKHSKSVQPSFLILPPDLTTLVSNGGRMANLTSLNGGWTIGFDLLLLDSTSFYWIQPHRFTGFNLIVLLDLTSSFYWIWPLFTGFDLLFLDLTSFYWIWPPPFTGFDLFLLDLTSSFYWIQPPFTGLDLQRSNLTSRFDLQIHYLGYCILQT